MISKFIFLCISAIFLCTACNTYHGPDDPPADNNYRRAMRQLVQGIAQKARQENPSFIVIPQNGQEVAWDSDEDIFVKPPDRDYLGAIDGIGREDLFFGYEKDNRPTPADDRDYMLKLCHTYQSNGKTVLVTDYCHGKNGVTSYEENSSHGFISFAAPERNLTVIPDNSGYFPYNVNSNDISRLAGAGNFLYLLNPENYSSAENFVTSIAQTDYDLLIIDLFFDDSPLSAAQVARLKTKANGGRRLVIAYMSIGEAENYRWYWDEKAPWIARENPDWPGNYKVHYWNDDWQKIIYSGTNSYLDKILAAGFDGVYLDIIDAYEFFENL